MNFSLKILGSASAMPVSEMNPSAQVLNVHGRLFLIDCGEGTQHRMVEYGISMLKIESIFISHIHGDHVFGIFGLLSTMAMKGRLTPLHIYAPNNFGPILKFFLSYYGEGILYDIIFHEQKGKDMSLILETKNVEIYSFPLNHKIETYGYLFKEKDPLFNVHKYKIEQYKLNLLEIGAIKRGEDIVRDGEIIYNTELAYKPYKPVSYAYCSDTAYYDKLEEWLKNVDYIYHETTYLSGNEDIALSRYHSTTLQAAQLAKKINAKTLLIGHYSSRCLKRELYQSECCTIFPNTIAVKDGDKFDF